MIEQSKADGLRNDQFVFLKAMKKEKPAFPVCLGKAGLFLKSYSDSGRDPFFARGLSSHPARIPRQQMMKYTLNFG